MESLFKQIENWITNLIEQRVTAGFNNPALLKTVSREEIEEIIDNCIADKIDANFDIHMYEDVIADIAETTISNGFDIHEHLDISDYEDEIKDVVSSTFETKSIDILIPQ